MARGGEARSGRIDIDLELVAGRDWASKGLKQAEQQSPIGAPDALRTQFDDAIDAFEGSQELELPIKCKNWRTKTHFNFSRWCAWTDWNRCVQNAMFSWPPRGCWHGIKTSKMDLALNERADFTRWMVSEGLLREPFVLVDVGVQGGENQRWQPLGDRLVVHGFDPIEEVVRELTEGSYGGPNRYYHCMALGNVDGKQTFYFNPANPTASSMYRQGTGRYDVENAEQPRQVPIRRLDSLLAEGLIPQADFIKVDVAGFEKEVLLGAGAPF